MTTPWVLASDIDGTLTGDRAELDRLAARLAKRRADRELVVILSTGRRLSQVISGVAAEGLPEPDAVICQVGTEIYLPPLHAKSRPLATWRDRLTAQYRREEALALLEGIEGLVLQPSEFNTDLKTSCFLDGCPDPEAAAAEIARRAAPHGDRYQVIWSSGRDLDVLPEAAGKGKAIQFLVEHLGLSADRVVVAGDSGNDATMFEHFRRGVVVANAQDELLRLAAEMDRGRVFVADRPYAAGVAQGLEHFGLAPR